MGSILTKILTGLAVAVVLPFYLIYKIIKFLGESIISFLKNRKKRNVYYTEDGIKLVNSTMTRREKFMIFITIISTSTFFLMALAATFTFL